MVISSAEKAIPGPGVSEKATDAHVFNAKSEAHAAPVPATGWRRLLDQLASFGRVELRGITPIPVEERTVKRTINVFTLWWSINANILAYVLPSPPSSYLWPLLLLCVVFIP